MKRIYAKVFITAAALLLSVVMILSVSYAWLVISKSPAANGISVMIGGGKTILLAADVAKTVIDGEGNTTVVHYPGSFGETLELSVPENSGALSPVSTADGVCWIIPKYDEKGELLPVTEFTVDNALQFANGGGYICLDFWIVSPGSEYDVRVSMDRQTGEGSYLVELPGVIEDGQGGFTLAESRNVLAASARVGFLVSTANAGSAALNAYLASDGYDERYTALLGAYAEPQEQQTGETRFTIYEPNGTLHPGETGENYVVTSPLWYDGTSDQIRDTDISDRLTVQKASTWRTVSAAEDGEEQLLLEQILQVALAGKSGLSQGAARDAFLNYLNGQTGAYLTSGQFFKSTAALYSAAQSEGDLPSPETAGASDSAAITRLERNTPQRVRMFIWLEGQDADCRNEGLVSSSQIALKIELAGATP